MEAQREVTEPQPCEESAFLGGLPSMWHLSLSGEQGHHEQCADRASVQWGNMCGVRAQFGEDSFHRVRWEHSAKSQNLSSKWKTSLRRTG